MSYIDFYDFKNDVVKRKAFMKQLEEDILTVGETFFYRPHSPYIGPFEPFKVKFKFECVSVKDVKY